MEDERLVMHRTLGQPHGRVEADLHRAARLPGSAARLRSVRGPAGTTPRTPPASAAARRPPAPAAARRRIAGVTTSAAALAGRHATFTNGARMDTSAPTGTARPTTASKPSNEASAHRKSSFHLRQRGFRNGGRRSRPIGRPAPPPFPPPRVGEAGLASSSSARTAPSKRSTSTVSAG